jgi:hypothetical protein
MALTFFDVAGRKLLDNSIPGSLELTELLMVVVIFGALPLVSLRGEHVEFDSLDPTCRLGCAAQAAGARLCAAVLLALGWLMWRTGGQFARPARPRRNCKILKAPFIYGMACCAPDRLVHLACIAQPPASAPKAKGRACDRAPASDSRDLRARLLRVPLAFAMGLVGFAASASRAAGSRRWPAPRRWSTRPASPTRCR